MANRYFSSNEYWSRKAKEWQPLLSYRNNNSMSWPQWREEAAPKLQQLLGEFPAKVDLAAELAYIVEDEELMRERVIFDSEAFASVPCSILYPKNMSRDRSHAAVICCNGHPADLGKDPVAGIRGSDKINQTIARMNYDYGKQLAKAGFFVIVPDLRNFGERNDEFDRKDVCDRQYVKGSLLGIYPLTLNIWDIKCTIDYLETRPEIHPQRIGMMGLSFGGTMTAFTAALDERIRASVISGYINSFSRFALERNQVCGSQVVPELYKYLDTGDIAGLIAPRPLLVEMGIYDQCFFIQDLLKGFEQTEAIYKAAEAADALVADIHPGAHAFSGNKAFDFFRRHLQNPGLNS